MKPNDFVLKEVIENALIQSSSDLIVALYQTFLRIDCENTFNLDPIVRWEFSNYHDEWTLNISYIQKKLENLDEQDYDEIHAAYTFATDFLLTNPVMCSIFKIDDKDVIGWKILKELREKRDLVDKMRCIAKFNRKEKSK